MPIDPSQVQWDDQPASPAPQPSSATGIDPNQVQWDDTPIQDMAPVRATLDISSWPDSKINFPATPNSGLLDYIKAVRPEYASIPEKELVWAAHRALYPDVSPVEFLRATGYAEKVGLKPEDVASGGEQALAGMSGGQKFLAGAGQSLASTGRGISQLAGLLSREDVDAAREVDAPLLRTGAGLGGAITGNVAQIVAPGGALKLGAKVPQLARAAPALDAAGSAFLPPTVRGAAASGAGFGAVQEVGTDDSRLKNIGIGGLAGTLGAALPRAATAVTERAARLSPALTQGQQERAAAEVLERFAQNPDNLATALQGQRTIVPGSLPTTAEATGDVGLAGLQRFLGNTPEFANELTLLKEANNRARVGALEQAFGGADEQAAAAARQAVRDAQGPAIREAMKQTGAETQKVIRSIDRASNSARFRNVPEAQQALTTVRDMLAVPIDDAGRLSAGRGVIVDALSNPKRMSGADRDALVEARRIVISGQKQGLSADDVLREVRKIKPKSLNAQSALGDMMRALRIAEKGKPDVASLYNARKYITGTLMQRATPEAMMALRGITKNLDDQISEVAPTYKQYLTEYAQGMREADRIDVGAELLSTGRAVRGATNEPDLTAAAFGRAAGNLDRTVQRATGFNRTTAEKTLTKDQIRVVDEVRRDLERFSRAQTRTLPVNSATASNAIGGNRVQDAIGPVGAAMIEPVSGAALLFLNAARKNYGEKVAGIVNEAMLNPDRAAEILARLPPKSRRAITRQVAPLLNQAGSVSGRAAPPLVQD